MENKFKKYMELTGLTEGVVDDMTSGDLTDEQKNRIKFCMPSGVAKLSAGSIETLEEIIGEDIDGDDVIETAPEAGNIIVETTPEAGAGEGTVEGDGADLDDTETTTPTPDAGAGEGTVEGDSGNLDDTNSDLEDPTVNPDQDF